MERVNGNVQNSGLEGVRETSRDGEEGDESNLRG